MPGYHPSFLCTCETRVYYGDDEELFELDGVVHDHDADEDEED